MLFFVVDPARSGAEGDKTAAEEPAGWATILAVWAETKECMRIPTFWVIVLQGVFGSTPWAAWGFSTLWLQLICFRSELAANIRACFVSAPQRLATVVKFSSRVDNHCQIQRSVWQPLSNPAVGLTTIVRYSGRFGNRCQIQRSV